MATFEANGPLAHRSLMARHAARLDACWPCVRVDAVQVTPNDSRRRVRALVQLGGLTPADVRVELIPADAAEEVAGRQREERWLFSSHPLANGCFVFETTLPPRETGEPGEWLIHVHPSEALDEPEVERRFRIEQETS